MDALVEKFNASIPYDNRLYEYDIQGSIAHVTMLGEQGIVSKAEMSKIVKGLEEIRAEIKAGVADGSIVFDIADEDIHMCIEKKLIAKLGETGKKLHTSRSRNDQNAVDMRLYLRDEIQKTQEIILYLEEALLKKAQDYHGELMIGFTHMQHAQPVTIGFHLMAYFQMFKRDVERLSDIYKRVNVNPLGACALAGTTLPINRHRTSELLGFSAPTETRWTVSATGIINWNSWAPPQSA
jgi:argininosuccinate lyase